MKMTLEIIQEKKNRKSFSLRVYNGKKRPGVYTIHLERVNPIQRLK
jgi:hypothetical protein